MMKNEHIPRKLNESSQGFTFLNSSLQSQSSMILSSKQSACSTKPPHDDQLTTISSNSSNLVETLPGKVYENCQRTARVIMLSQLQKSVNKDKKLKLLLTKILSEFMPNKNQSQSGSEYSSKKGYYESLHYSRVRIGQRQFLKNILLNQHFKEIFQTLFMMKSFGESEKARKNERSQISFEQRRQIISNIIQQYEKKFEVHFKISQNQPNSAPNKNSDKILEQKQLRSEQKQLAFKQHELDTITQIEEKMLIPLIVFPIVPIPLLPAEYQFWQKTRAQSQ